MDLAVQAICQIPFSRKRKISLFLSAESAHSMVNAKQMKVSMCL